MEIDYKDILQKMRAWLRFQKKKVPNYHKKTKKTIQNSTKKYHLVKRQLIVYKYNPQYLTRIGLGSEVVHCSPEIPS